MENIIAEIGYGLNPGRGGTEAGLSGAPGESRLFLQQGDAFFTWKALQGP